MTTKLLTSLAIAATTLTGVFSYASAATAFSWNSTWTQPKIYKESEVGFKSADYQKYVQQERVELSNSGQLKLDPAKLFLTFDHNVTVSFINEGAQFRDQLAFSSTGKTTREGLIFNDVSCGKKDIGCVGSKWGGDALDFGDTVKLGTIKAGSQLDFFLRADGLNLGDKANLYSTKTELNPDKLDHAVAYAIGTRYILLAFEDLYGEKGKSGGKNQKSDRDFNDTVFVVDVGEGNIKCLTKGACPKVPEPSIALSLLGLGVAGYVTRRRQNNSIE